MKRGSSAARFSLLSFDVPPTESTKSLPPKLLRPVLGGGLLLLSVAGVFFFLDDGFCDDEAGDLFFPLPPPPPAPALEGLKKASTLLLSGLG